MDDRTRGRLRRRSADTIRASLDAADDNAIHTSIDITRLNETENHFHVNDVSFQLNRISEWKPMPTAIAADCGVDGAPLDLAFDCRQVVRTIRLQNVDISTVGALLCDRNLLWIHLRFEAENSVLAIPSGVGLFSSISCDSHYRHSIPPTQENYANSWGLPSDGSSASIMSLIVSYRQDINRFPTFNSEYRLNALSPTVKNLMLCYWAFIGVQTVLSVDTLFRRSAESDPYLNLIFHTNFLGMRTSEIAL